MPDIAVLGLSLAHLLPLVAVWVTGVVVAVTRWERHPRTSRLVVLGIGLLLVLTVISRILSVLLPVYLSDRAELTNEQMGWVLGGLAFLWSTLTAGVWVLLLLAIFGERGKQPRPPFSREEDALDNRGEDRPPDTGIRTGRAD